MRLWRRIRWGGWLWPKRYLYVIRRSIVLNCTCVPTISFFLAVVLIIRELKVNIIKVLGPESKVFDTNFEVNGYDTRNMNNGYAESPPLFYETFINKFSLLPLKVITTKSSNNKYRYCSLTVQENSKTLIFVIYKTTQVVAIKFSNWQPFQLVNYHSTSQPLHKWMKGVFLERGAWFVHWWCSNTWLFLKL